MVIKTHHYASLATGLITYFISFQYNPPNTQTNFVSKTSAEAVSPLENKVYPSNHSIKTSPQNTNHKIPKQTIGESQTSLQTTRLIECLEYKTKSTIGQLGNDLLLVFTPDAKLPESLNRLFYDFPIFKDQSYYFLLTEDDAGIQAIPGFGGNDMEKHVSPLSKRQTANLFKSLMNSPYIDNDDESNWKGSWSECLSYATTATEAARPFTDPVENKSTAYVPPGAQSTTIPNHNITFVPKSHSSPTSSHYKQGSLTIHPTINTSGKKKPKGNNPSDYQKLMHPQSQRLILPPVNLEAKIDPELAICAATDEEQDNVIEFLTTNTNYFSKNPYQAVEEIDGIKDSCSDILQNYHLVSDNRYTLSATVALTTPPKSDNYLIIKRFELVLSLENDN